MNTTKNYYETLEIPSNTPYGDDLIKKQFRKLSKQYHPDCAHDLSDEEKFKDIQEAYSVLSDDDKRREYDMSTGFNPDVQRRRNMMEDFFGEIHSFNPFADAFNNIFQMRHTIQVGFQIDIADIYYGKLIKDQVSLSDRFNNAKIYDYEINIEPRKLKNYYEKIIKMDNGGNLVLRLTPDIKLENKNIICSSCVNIELSNSLDMILTFDIPFIDVIKGSEFTTKIFDKEIKLKLPRSFKYGYTINTDKVGILESSKTILKFNYSIPIFNEKQVEKIKKAMNL